MLTLLLTFLVLYVGQGVYRNWDVYMGRRPDYDSMAEHLNEPHEVEENYQDDSQFGGWFGRVWKRFHKIIKPWSAFSWTSRYKWARFRQYPLTLLTVNGQGMRRWETTDGRIDLGDSIGTSGSVYAHSMYETGFGQQVYLSRCQYWSRWHFQLQWPFFVAFHYYPNAKDVVRYPGGSNGTDGKVRFFYFGFKRDGDGYLIAFFLGRNWK